MNINYSKAVVGGLAGTVVMTVVGVFLAPMMGMPKMNPADMLAGAMGGNAMLGWAAHLMIGTVLALIYAAVAGSLPGAPWLRGALFAIAPWLLAQIVVMPMMGMGLFSGSAYIDQALFSVRENAKFWLREFDVHSLLRSPKRTYRKKGVAKNQPDARFSRVCLNGKSYIKEWSCVSPICAGAFSIENNRSDISAGDRH